MHLPDYDALIESLEDTNWYQKAQAENTKMILSALEYYYDNKGQIIEKRWKIFEKDMEERRELQRLKNLAEREVEDIEEV